VDTSAVSNSSSELDLTVLERRQSTPGFDIVSSSFDVAFDGANTQKKSMLDPEVLNNPNNCIYNPTATRPEDQNEMQLSQSLVAPPDTSETPATGTPGKRKSNVLDKILELHAADRETRRESLDRFMLERKELAESKVRARAEARKLELELKEQSRERDRELEREKMAHEREMMKMKLEYAKLQGTSAENMP
jgi:hypothetical protein